MKVHRIKAFILTGFFAILLVPNCFAESFSDGTLKEMNNYGTSHAVIELEQSIKAVNELPVKKISKGDNSSHSSVEIDGNDENNRIDPSRDTVR